MTDEDFIKFIESFKNGKHIDENQITHYFYDTLSELSKSDSGQKDSIIENKFKMYGLDWIVKESDIWKDNSTRCKKNPKLCKNNFPKSVDAMFINLNNDNLILHLIEFKFIPSESNSVKLTNLYNHIITMNNKYKMNNQNGYEQTEKKCFDKKFVENFKIIKDEYIDTIVNSLQLKPYEVIFIVLPMLYEEYCKNNNEPLKDIKCYLSKIEKNYWVCIDSGTKNETKLHAQAKLLEQYYKRMKPVIVKDANVKTKKDFEKNLKNIIT